MILALRLGLRAASARARRGRLVSLFVIGFVACSCLLVVAMAPTVKTHERERNPHLAAGTASSAASYYVNRVSYRGRHIALVQVPNGPASVRLPPGIHRPIPVGQVRLSPALADRIDQDGLLARWFPYARGPDLSRSAVVSAGDYTAYIGVPASDLAFTAGTPEQGLFSEADFGYYQWLGFLLFVGLPGGGLLVMAGRFGRRVRRERYAALRLLGLPHLPCRLVGAVEVGLPVTAGAVLAGFLALTLRPGHVVVPMVQRWVFGQDARLPSTLVAFILLSVCTLAFAIGAAASVQRGATGRLRALTAGVDGTRTWIVAIYLVGLGLLVLAWQRAQPNNSLLFAGILIAGAGIPAAVTFVARAAAPALGRGSSPMPWFLGMRKLAADPRALTRVAGLVGIVVYGVGVAQPITQLVTSPNSTWVGEAHRAGRSSVLGKSESGEEGLVPLVLHGQPPAGTSVAALEIRVRSVDGTQNGTALLASCRDLRTLLAHRLPACDDATVQRLDDPDSADGPPVPGPYRLDDSRGQTVGRLPAVRSGVTAAAYRSSITLPRLRLSPRLLPPGARPFVTGVYVRTRADADAWVAAQGWVAASSPFFRTVNEFDEIADDDTTGAWIILGFAFAAGVAALASILAHLDDRATADPSFGLRALGVGRSSLVLVRVASAVVAAASAVLVATIPALVAAQVWLRVGNEHLASYLPFGVAALVGVGVIVTVELLSSLRLGDGTQPR